MKKRVQQDERVLAQKRKIGSDAFNIVWIGLLISVLVQQYLFSASFAQYAVEVVLFVASSLYIVFRNLLSGNTLFATKKRGQVLVVTNSLVCGLTVAVINTVLNYAKYNDVTPLPIGLNTFLVVGITFISATLTAFIVLELVYLANKRKQEKIERLLDEDE